MSSWDFSRLQPWAPQHWPYFGPCEPALMHIYDSRFWRTLLLAMLVALALVAFWPTPVDRPVAGTLAQVLNFLHSRGIPSWFNYKFVEASANVLLFIPLGLAGSFAFPGRQWWQIGLLGLLTSCCMELGQLLFLYYRSATPQDLVTNTLGAVIGASLATVTRKISRPTAFRQRT